jgi:hypothetical protein
MRGSLIDLINECFSSILSSLSFEGPTGKGLISRG